MKAIFFFLGIGVVATIAIISMLIISHDKIDPEHAASSYLGEDIIEQVKNIVKPDNTQFPQFKTDTNNTSIDLDMLLSGGPGKDGIPALTDPVFESISDSDLGEGVLGVYVDIEGDQRFYPYTILVWHEIVNDVVGGESVAVTFCPLCGTGIVFDRDVKGDILDFGVSGFLYESNMVMYDRQTESFWSQSLGRAIVGDYLDTELDLVDMQLLTYGEVMDKFPGTKILSPDTEHARDYTFYPYGDYESNNSLFSPVSVSDDRFSLKELMYVIRVDDTSITFPLSAIMDDEVETWEYQGHSLIAKRDGGEIFVTVDGEKVPGYVEMWFSWVTGHNDDGVVWKFE